MVFLSSDPRTNPFSASVACLTVLQIIVDSLRDTLSGSGEAACTEVWNSQIVENTATVKRMRLREGAWIAIDVPSNALDDPIANGPNTRRNKPLAN
jgi:hypothetical protein